jgi:phosphate-selective porin OprO/OprP
LQTSVLARKLFVKEGRPTNDGRSRLLRIAIVAAAGTVIICSSLKAQEAAEPASASDSAFDDIMMPTLSKVVSYRPLLGGFDDPVTGTHINGHLFVDGAAYINDSSGQFSNSIDVRRARLSFRNGFAKDWTFKASAEISTNPISVEIKDLYLLYTGLSFGALIGGNRKEPFSLEGLVSARYTTMMEKAMPIQAMIPGRNVGITISALWNKRTALTAGLFGQGFKEDGLRASGTALTGRVTHLFIDEPQHQFHLGLSGSYRHIGSTDSIRFRSRPEVGITENYMVDTGDLSAVDVPRVGFEAAYINGPLSLQSEFIASWVTRSSGRDTLFFQGWYAQAAWFLTGETRPFDRGSARFGRIDPLLPVGKGGKGAWEVALRMSRVDLSDDDVIGGEETNLTVGVTWYLSSTMRLMTNYVNVLEMDRPGSVFDGNTMSLFEARFQIEF